MDSDTEEQPEQQHQEVRLNTADRSLDCQVDGQWVSTFSREGFGYLWSGVRATHGIIAGRYWFSVQISEPLETTLTNIGDSADMYYDEDATANTIHCCRIGVSRLSTDIDELGNVNSWGYGSTGKKSTGKIYSKYPSGPEGRTYGPGDEIACFVEVSQDDSAASQQSSSRRRGPNAPGSGSSRGSAIISFAVNGECLGPAFTLHQSAEQDKALFPHVLVKNLLVLVRFRGERPLHWPQDKPWDGTWCGCLPWQACVSQSPPPVLGPRLQHSRDCQVIMMIGLPGANKSQQLDRLTGQQQQHGSRTFLYRQEERDPAAGAQAGLQQQQPPRKYVKLSTETIINQMKVPNAPRRGGTAARAACGELLANAEFVFEQLLELAAQHPANYIIDGSKCVLAESRSWIIEGFRAAGFKLVAAVIVEHDHVINQRMNRRDGTLWPDYDTFLHMKANFSLPEESPNDFDEVHYLGSITDPQQAAQIVAAQRASAQHEQLMHRSSSGLGFNQYPSTYPPDMLSPGLSNGSSGQLYRGISDHSGRRSSNDSSGRLGSQGLGYGLAPGPGFTPWNPAGQLYRPPQYGESPAVYNTQRQGGYGQPAQQQGLGSVGPGFGFPPMAQTGPYSAAQYYGAVPGQYQQRTIYDPSMYTGANAAAAPAAGGQCSPHAQQYMAGEARRRSSGGSSMLEANGSVTSSGYVRQPSWVGPQASQGLASSSAVDLIQGHNPQMSQGSRSGFSNLPSQGPGFIGHQGQQGLGAYTPGIPVRGTPSRASTPDGSSLLPHEGYGLEQQQRQQQYQQQQKQAWGPASPAAAQPAAADSWPDLSSAVPRRRSGSGSKSPAVQNQQSAAVQQQPSVGQVASPFATGDLQQRYQQELPAQQALQQQMQQLHMQAPVQQGTPADVTRTQQSVNPFLDAAKQPPAWPSRAAHAANGKHASQPSAAGNSVQPYSVSQLPDGPQQQQNQQTKQQQSKQQSKLQSLVRKLSNKLGGTSFMSSNSTVTDDTAAGGAAAIQLTPELQRHLEQLHLECYTNESVVAALLGEGHSRKEAKKLGSGSFSSVFAVLLSDLQKCSPAEATSPTPTPVHSGDFTTAAVANGHGQPAAANGNSCKAASGNGSAAAGSSEQAESDGQIVAVKVLNAKYCTPDDFVRELEVLARCRHETLVVLQGYCLLRRALIFEYCPCGSLDDWLRGSSVTEGKKLSWRQRTSIAHQVATALHFLHSRKPEPVVHRDVKPNNILLTRSLSARLADVGLSKFLPFDVTSVYASQKGCVLFMPTESFLHGVVSPGADVFSFGLVLVQMITGDLRRWPRQVFSQLAEVFSGYEALLEAAASAAAGATSTAAAAGNSNSTRRPPGPGTVVYPPPGCSSKEANSSYSKTAAGPYATGEGTAAANAYAASLGPASSVAFSTTGSSRSMWWTGVMANCTASRDRSNAGGGGAGSSTSPGSRTASSVSDDLQSPTTVGPLATAAAEGPAKPSSWAAVAAAPCSPSIQPVRGTTSTRSTPASATSPDPQAAIAALVPATLPEGLAKMLDANAGVWPPRVAAGLAMIALACCEEQRRQRPRMEEVVAALDLLLRHNQ